MKTAVTLPSVNHNTRALIFDGVEDPRYTFPIWSWTSRHPRAFFRDPITGADEIIRGYGSFGVLGACANHRNAQVAAATGTGNFRWVVTAGNEHRGGWAATVDEADAAVRAAAREARFVDPRADITSADGLLRVTYAFNTYA